MSAPMRMSEMVILRVVSKAFVPFTLLFALYVQFHGDFGPGGGFQAGVIFAAGLILYGLIFGLDDLIRVAPAWVLECCLASGVLLYGGTGVASMLLGGQFLEYNVLVNDPSHPLTVATGSLAEMSLHVPNGHGQHLGLLLIEGGVGIAVACAMTLIFYAFAGRKAQES
jgi:multicomponent Na+:H+ antiporter subunit B